MAVVFWPITRGEQKAWELRNGWRQNLGKEVFHSALSTGNETTVAQVKTDLRSAHTRGLVPATNLCNKSLVEFTRKDWSQGLVPRTVHTKCFEELVAGTCPKNSNWFEFVGLVVGTKVGPCD